VQSLERGTYFADIKLVARSYLTACVQLRFCNHVTNDTGRLYENDIRTDTLLKFYEISYLIEANDLRDDDPSKRSIG